MASEPMRPLVTGSRQNIAALFDHPRFEFIRHDVTFTILELAQLTVEVTGSRPTIIRAPLPVGDPQQRRPDTGLAESVLRCKAGTPLRQGLQHAIAHFHKLLSLATSPAAALEASAA